MRWIGEGSYFGLLVCYFFMQLTLQFPTEHRKPYMPASSSDKATKTNQWLKKHLHIFSFQLIITTVFVVYLYLWDISFQGTAQYLHPSPIPLSKFSFPKCEIGCNHRWRHYFQMQKIWPKSQHCLHFSGDNKGIS